MSSNGPRFQGKSNVHTKAPAPAPEPSGAGHAGAAGSGSGCNSSTGTGAGQQEPEAQKRERTPDDRFGPDGKRIEMKQKKPTLITPKTLPAILKAGKRSADHDHLSEQRPQRPRLGPSPPSRHASLSDPASATGSLSHTRGRDSLRAVSGPSGTSSGFGQTTSTPTAGPAATASHPGPGARPLPYPGLPHVPQQPVPQTAPVPGRRDSQADAAYDSRRPLVNASGSTQSAGRPAIDGSGPAMLPEVQTRHHGPPAAVRGANVNTSTLARPHVGLSPTTPTAQALLPPRPAAHILRNGPQGPAPAPVPVLYAPAVNHQPAPRHTRAPLPAPAAIPTGSSSAPTGPSATPEIQYKCHACHASIPPGTSQYKNALRHVRTTHLTHVLNGLKAQARAEVAVVPAPNPHASLLRCMRCNAPPFPPGQRQWPEAEDHVIDTHLTEVRDGLDRQADKFLYTEPYTAARQ